MTDVGLARALQQIELRAHVHSAYLSRGARPGPSPRGPSDFRPLTVAAATEDGGCTLGSAEVRLGATHVTCGVTALVGVPMGSEEGMAQAPRGDIVFTCFLPPVYQAQAAEDGSSRAAREEEEARAAGLECALADIFVKSGAVDLEQLSLPKFGRALRLVVSVVVTSADGNVLDATVLAARAALRSTTLPRAEMQPQQGLAPRRLVLVLPRPRTGATGGAFERLRMLRDPICVSCAVCADASWPGPLLLLDPSQEEAAVSVASISVAVDERGDFCYFNAAPVSSSSPGSRAQSAASGAGGEAMQLDAQALQAAAGACARKAASLRAAVNI